MKTTKLLWSSMDSLSSCCRSPPVKPQTRGDLSIYRHFFFTCSWSNNSSPSYKLHMCWLRAPASGGRQNAPSKRKQCLYYIYMCFLLLQLIINVIMMIIEYFIYFGILCTFICVFCFCFLSFVVTF